MSFGEGIALRELLKNKKDEYFLTGHPNARRNKGYSYRENKIEIIGPIENGYIEAEVDDRPSYDEIIGQSGGGIFKVTNDKYSLAGIQSKMATKDEYESLGRVEIMPISFFDEIIGEFPLELEEFSTFNLVERVDTEKVFRKKIQLFENLVQKAISDENWDVAKQNLQKIIKLNPKHASAAEKINHVNQQKKVETNYLNGVRLFERKQWCGSLVEFNKVKKIVRHYRTCLQFNEK